MSHAQNFWQRTADAGRPLLAFLVSSALIAAGLVTLYRVDAATLGLRGWFYEALDHLYLFAYGSRLFRESYLDLSSLLWLGTWLLLFSLSCLLLIALGTHLLSASIRGGAAWQEAKALLREIPAPQTARVPSPTHAPNPSPAVCAASKVGRLTDYGPISRAEHRRSGEILSGVYYAPHAGRQPVED